MRWRSHLRIAGRISSVLNLSKIELSKLAKGSIVPDNWRDHPYHHNSEYLNQRIEEKIIKARKFFLRGNKQCFFETGVALHYICDNLIPATSYSVHLNIEEEIAKLSTYKPTCLAESRRAGRKRWSSEVMRKAIIDLNIKGSEKELLLNPNLVRGKRITLSLALIKPPLSTDSELLFNIAFRISFGVVASIISYEPPLLLLSEKIKNTLKRLNQHKIKRYLILEVLLPLVFLYYKKIGILAIGSITALNLLSIVPCILILKGKSIQKIKNYIKLRDYSKTLFIFFVFASIFAILVFKLFLVGALFALIAILHFIHPRFSLDKEVEEEINWYRWENF
ncbi:hypothetical protein KAW65_02085 [candidate division WOR-3 bacterium]|nr:hypothetical protein [candidate division WOR-3 bacterium]